jgi:RND family efflux transporter MFP subunit
VLPLLVLLVGIVSAVVLVRTRPAAEMRAREIPAPLVRVHVVRLQDVQLTVHSQGAAAPRTRTALVSQVPGRIVAVAPSFESGGFFEAGEVLLTIDPTDFELAVVRAGAAVAQADVRLATERAEAAVARREWEELGEGEAKPLVTRQPQVLEAEAALEAARAALRQAEVDLERTKIRVPYPGRVSTKSADVGQYVMRGMALGEVYAIDYAEVRLPVSDEELAFLDTTPPAPVQATSDASVADPAPSGSVAPEVVLRARFAGATREWSGRVVRTEGEIDPRTRMLHVVARIPDPYGRRQARDAPLAAGLFVQAEINGQFVRGVAVLPRGALRARDQVLLVDDDDRLRFRSVEVLRSQHEDVIVRSGLHDGDRVLLSPLEAVTDGMRVRTVEHGAAPREAP